MASNAERELLVSVKINPHMEPCTFKHHVMDPEGIPMVQCVITLMASTPLSKVQVSVLVEKPLVVNRVTQSVSSICKYDK